MFFSALTYHPATRGSSPVRQRRTRLYHLQGETGQIMAELGRAEVQSQIYSSGRNNAALHVSHIT